MKTWVKILLGIVGALALFIASIFYFTSDLTRVGDEFFAAVSSDDMETAYGKLSVAFQAGTSRERLAAYLATNRMNRVTKTSWSNRSVRTGGLGDLLGTLTTAEGENIPIRIDLIKEGDEWKIFAIRNTSSRPGVSNGPPGLPDENEQVTLVMESMAVFADAVAAHDMTEFHHHVSHLWARQTDVARLNDIYKVFFPIGAEIPIIKTLAPVFDDPATLSDDGVMEINGHFPTRPERFRFKLKYVYEGTAWKLAALLASIS